MMNRYLKWIVWMAIVASLVLCPMICGMYFTNVVVTFAIFALFAVSYNLLLGFVGLFSFGHAMYFGAGAYATALALAHIEGCPLLLSLLMGILGSLALALLLIPIVARLSHSAFAMIHLAFSMLLYVLALKLRNITGGEDGIGGFPIPSLGIPGVFSLDMTDFTTFYYFAMIVIGISVWVAWFITKTPFGQVMVSIRENTMRVGYMGFKVTHSKAVAYALSACFAGIAGSIYALFNDLVSADCLHIGYSFAPLLMTMVGGVGTFLGPIFGSAIFAVIEEITVRYTERVELVNGIILIVVIMYFPYGFMGMIGLIRRKILEKQLAAAAAEGRS